MTISESIVEAPLTAKYHREAIDEIIQCVEDGVYCALLGPRLCGKTVLLLYIQRVLSGMGWTCAYVDLLPMRAPTLQGFFAELTNLVSGSIREETGIELKQPDPAMASSAVFRAFLTDSVAALHRDLVLIIEHLETVPTDLAQSLLTSLRAAYMDQQNQEFRLVVIVSGALSLASLTVGESSPFRGITRRVFVGDLSPDESCDMIADFLVEEGIEFTPQARQMLQEDTSGDTFLIRTLSQQSAESIILRGTRRLGTREVRKVTNRFLRRDVYHYAPLLEAVRMIEDDPDLMHCILVLLENELVRKAELPLLLSPDLDPLYLTGVVEAVDGDSYRLQNLIYRRFLQSHFNPGRVGHVLAMAGRWDAAIDYLETSLRLGIADFRLDLLPATINSMYASDNLDKAASYLTRALSSAFDVNEAEVWYAPPGEKVLRLIRFMGEFDDSEFPAVVEIPVQADQLEARAYRQAVSLRGQEEGVWLKRAFPLQVRGSKPIGVVSLWDRLAEGRALEQRRRDLQLVGFLTQAARALQAVALSRQELAMAGRMQVSLLPDEVPHFVGWDFAVAWHPARETSGDFYDFISLPGGKLGITIADVADKGMGAALYMVLCRTYLHNYAGDFPEHPFMVLQETNRRLIRDVGSRNFASVFYGVLNPLTGELDYSNAGHNPPILFTGDTVGHSFQLFRTGMALGVGEDSNWEQEKVQMTPGAVLLLYTDGITDAHNRLNEAFGEQRLTNLARLQIEDQAEMILSNVQNAVKFHSSDSPQFDDMTLMVVKRLS